jgi:hypothetical protein
VSEANEAKGTRDEHLGASSWGLPGKSRQICHKTHSQNPSCTNASGVFAPKPCTIMPIAIPLDA